MRLINQVLLRPKRSWRTAIESVIKEKFPDENVYSAIEQIRNDPDNKKYGVPSFLLVPYKNEAEINNEYIELNTDEIVDVALDIAERAAINLEVFSYRLTGRKQSSEYAVAIALRTILEVEGFYIEHPGALTIYKIPKEILIILSAAVIGISTAKVSQLDPILAGSISGVGSLLINILASRYSNEEDPKIDWLEEFILQTIEKYGIQSFAELREKTNIDSGLLKKTLSDLKKKELVKEHKSWLDRTNLKYDLRDRHL